MGILDTAARTATLPARQALRVGGWAFGTARRLAMGDTAPLEEVRDEAVGAADEVVDAARPAPAPKDLGDADLTNKVRTEIFRNLRGVDKGLVDVNVVDGAVYLRGVAKTPLQINRLEERARAIPEVREVHNLLHLPGTPAPTRTDTPAAQRKTRRRSGTAPERPRREPRRVNADKTVKHRESLPEEIAAEGRGRPAAPLGSTDPDPAGPPSSPPGGPPA